MSGIIDVVYGKITVGTSSIDALVVGRRGINENDGVFAVSINKIGRVKNQQILWTFYAGDDGNWRKLITLDSHWIVRIIQCLLIGIDHQDAL